MSSRLVCYGNSSPSSTTTTNTSLPVLTNTTNPVVIEEKCSVCMTLPSSSSRRKKVCALCLQAVCTSCIPIDPRSRNHKVCSICQIIICNLSTRSDLERLKTQHLVRFIDANRIDRRGCRDKSEIVELILREFSPCNITSVGKAETMYH
ncbi:hypothetical protein GJ496_008272 [Pomphorhynchus laevis]|nr:hypothetical protein GJ496_008272 [Pomphorhynchus laevis]